MDLWTVGCTDFRLSAEARSPMGKLWKTPSVSHRLPTGRRLPTSSTALPISTFIFMIREDTRGIGIVATGAAFFYPPKGAENPFSISCVLAS